MRLHNRQIKATFWNDPDLLRWPRDKRWFYEGLSQLADDSGCLEDDLFAFKLNLFPSPLDADISESVLGQWRDECIEQNKIIRYYVAGKPYLFMINFHKHQTLDKPTPPNKASVPLPPWIIWEEVLTKDGKKSRRGSRYNVDYKGILGQCPDNGRTSPGLAPVELGTRNLEPELGTGTITNTPLTPVDIANEFDPAALEEDDGSSRQELFKVFEHELGRLLSSFEVEEILAWTEKHSPELIQYALKQAILNNVRTFKYIRGILANWKGAGAKCVQDAEDHERKFQLQKRTRAPDKKPSTRLPGEGGEIL